jgi:hypothetical protein
MIQEKRWWKIEMVAWKEIIWIWIYLHSINPKQVNTFGYRTSQRKWKWKSEIRLAHTVSVCKGDVQLGMKLSRRPGWKEVKARFWLVMYCLSSWLKLWVFYYPWQPQCLSDVGIPSTLNMDYSDKPKFCTEF